MAFCSGDGRGWLREAMRRVLGADGVVITVDYLSDGRTTLYTRRHRSLAEPPVLVSFLANAVGAALLVDAAGQPEGQPGEGEEWASRSVVHQATRMVIAQVRVTAEDAMALLRGHAYAMSSDLSDVAALVVDRKINFSNFDVEGD